MEELILKMKLRNNITNTIREDFISLKEPKINKDSFREIPSEDTLIEINIPEGIETIESKAFVRYENLEAIYFPESLKTIGFLVSEKCKKIKHLELPSNIEKIDYAAFFMLGPSIVIKLPKSLKLFRATSFGRAFLILNPDNPYFYQGDDKIIYTADKKQLVWAPIDSKEIKVIEGAQLIQESSLSSLEQLEKIELPESINSIENYSLCGCANLKAFKIPKNITKLCENVLAGCNSLTELIITDNIVSIEAFALSHCANIKKIFIPKTVKEVSFYAFCNWNEDQSIVFESREFITNPDFSTDAKISYLD